MIRDIAFAHFFGADWLMTAWTMGFKIPNLSRRLFGEGAASASLIPVYSEQLHNNPQQAKHLANTVVTFVFIILAAIVLVGELLLWIGYVFYQDRTGPKLGIILCTIMLPYMIFVCVVALLAGILNVHRYFAAPAAAPIVLNLCIISSILLTGWWLKIERETQVFYVAAAVLVSGLAQLAIQVPSLRACGVSIRPEFEVQSEAFKKVILLMVPMIIGQAVTQINTFADDIVALSFMNENGTPLSFGAPSYLYYAQRLYQLPLGILGISLATAIFPVMSADAARKDYKTLKNTVGFGLRSAIFIAIPATAGMFLVSKPLIAAIFQHGEFTSEDSAEVSWVLCFYVLGLCGYFSQQVLTRSFYSMQDSVTPVKSGLIAVGVNICLNLSLIWILGSAGLAAATALCSYLQVTILVCVLKKKLGNSLTSGFTDCLIKTLAATAVMYIIGILILSAMKNLPDGRIYDVLKLVVVVPLAVAVYFITAKILKIDELSLFTKHKRT